MTVSVIFDDEGRVAGLEETWLFDDFYTVFTMEGRDTNGDGKLDDEEMAATGREIVSNISEYDYLTEIRQGDEQLKVGSAEMIETHLQGGTRLSLTFRLDLAEPADASGKPVTYSSYDPSYYIEMLHTDATSILMTGHPLPSCRTKLQKANPTMEMVALASGLDKLEQGPDTLGAQFAETVTIDCRPVAEESVN